MGNAIIKIPRAGTIDAEEFYANQIHEALTQVNASGKRALYMPELVDARIGMSKDSRIWQVWFTAPSIRATGRSKSGKEVVVYHHGESQLSNPEYVQQNLSGLRNGAAAVSQEEFQRLLDLEDNQNTFVIDYSTLRNSTSDAIKVKDALKHPQTVPFLGGKERSEAYLEKYSEVYGKNIGVWHSDDLDEAPRGRLLFLGLRDIDLDGDNLKNDGRFLGVSKVAEGDARKNMAPTLEQVLKVTGEYTPPRLAEELRGRLSSLYS